MSNKKPSLVAVRPSFCCRAGVRLGFGHRISESKVRRAVEQEQYTLNFRVRTCAAAALLAAFMVACGGQQGAGYTLPNIAPPPTASPTPIASPTVGGGRQVHGV